MNFLKPWITFLLFILFSALSALVVAQDLTFNHHFWGVEDGLPSKEVFCGIQDQQGFLWFGTRNGLSRYDGSKFTTLTTEDGLQYNQVVALAEDSDGKIWISYGKEDGSHVTDGSTDIYNPFTGELVPIEKEFTNLPFDHNGILSIVPNAQGDIYLIIQPTLLYRYQPRLGFELVLNFKKEELLNDWINLREFANNGSFAFSDTYIYYENRIVKKKGDAEVLVHFNKENFLEYVSVNKNSKIPELKIDTYTSTRQIKTEYKACDSLTFHVLSHLENGRWNDRYGSSILLSSQGSLFIFSNYQCRRLEIQDDIGASFSLNEYFFSDRQGNYWICTPNGLHQFIPSPKKFQVLFNKDAYESNSLMANQVRSIFADTLGNVWIGGYFGVVYYQQENDQYTDQYTARLNDDFSWIHCFDRREENLYMLGSVFHSMNLENMQLSENYTHEFASTDPELYISTIGMIWAVYPLSEQHYLLGSDHGGVLIWNIPENSFREIEFCGQPIPQKNYIYRIIFSPTDQHYWAVGGMGCYRISKDLCITDYYGQDHVRDEMHQLPVSDFRDLHEDAEGIFWLATDGHGLLRWDRSSDDFQFFNIQDGMPSNTLYCILPDDFGNLWISTNDGLVRFNKSTHAIKVYSTEDGIANNEFNRIASFEGDDGQLYFGGIDGVTTFHPRDFEMDSLSPKIPLAITRLQQFVATENKLTDLTHQILTDHEIVLNPGDNFFRLDFALLDFRFPVKRYKYQMEGWDNDWQYTSESTLGFSGLGYGNYTLHIAGLSQTGKWSKQELTIPIRVLRPFYLEWWAFVGYGLVFLAFLYLFRKFQIRRTLAVADIARLEEINLLKTKLYTNITHEFRTPLTVIIGMAQQLETHEGVSAKRKDELQVTNEENIKLILRNANNLLHLINQMLDLSKLDSRKVGIDWERGDLVLFLHYLSNSFHAYAATKDIHLVFESTVNMLEMDYDRKKIQHIVSNLLSNAIKFSSKGGNILFQVSEIPPKDSGSEPMLQMKISDSGIGIPSEHLGDIFDRFHQIDDSATRKEEGSGIGLALTKELVELMGGSIAVKSQVGQGSVFQVLLPIHTNADRKPDSTPKETEILVSNQIGDKLTLTSHENSNLPLLLLIEDNADVAIYIRRCVEAHYHVLWTENGQLGIEKALETIPDIIISDVMMPEKDGFEVTQLLKNDERTSHIPIILLTAKADMESKIAGLEKGADAYLAKPFDKQELQVRVEKLVELRRKLRKRFQSVDLLEDLDPPHIDLPGIDLAMEDQFLKKVSTVIQDHLSNPELSVGFLCQNIGMSSSQLGRKLSALAHTSPSNLIRDARLAKAKALLQNNPSLSIADIAYDIGLNDPNYFTRLFVKETGMTPTDFRKKFLN